VAIAAGAQADQVDRLAAQLVADKTIRIDYAKDLLKKWSV
jgi:hydroxymethylglutaryl-CoA reductase